MAELNYTELQERYGGQFVALHRGQVLASAPTYEALHGRLEALEEQVGEIVVEYVERPDCAYVY